MRSRRAWSSIRRQSNAEKLSARLGELRRSVQPRVGRSSASGMAVKGALGGGAARARIKPASKHR